MNTLTTVRELQQRITQMQPLRLHEKTLPTPEEFTALLPDGALVQGGTVAVNGSIRLALALLSAASQAGAWCGAIGIPALSVETVHRIGISLERFIMVPHPGNRTLSITGTLSEVFSVLLICPPPQSSASEIERVHAKLRDHGTALIVLGSWPRTGCTLNVTDSSWEGLGQGQGMFDAHEMCVQSEDRRGIIQHRIRLHVDSLNSVAHSFEYAPRFSTPSLRMVPQ